MGNVVGLEDKRSHYADIRTRIGLRIVSLAVENRNTPRDSRTPWLPTIDP